MIEESVGERFTLPARIGFYNLMNFIGGAFIFVNREYSGRIKLVLSSWNAVQKTQTEDEVRTSPDKEEDETTEAKEVEEEKEVKGGKEVKEDKEVEKNNLKHESAEIVAEKGEVAMRIPTTFNEMILFNASVMGFGASQWMKIMLVQFDDMVRNVGNFSRLQEECDVMSLVLAKYQGPIELQEFKAVTLASLRSLLPDKWDSEHEVAWSWLWENLEALLRSNLGKPAAQEAALSRFYDTQPKSLEYFQHQIFPAFLEIAPAGQEFLKQSSTRILFISTKVTSMVLDIYRYPTKIVEASSANGLRHVGYGIPTEMFPPFVTAAVAVRPVTKVLFRFFMSDASKRFAIWGSETQRLQECSIAT